MQSFFVLALGRSGTKFLASLLTQVEGATVHHEPWPYDHHLMRLRHAGGFDKVVDGLLRQRFDAMLAGERPAIYGEVNSYLRYEADWLQRQLDAQVIHLVRDGRAFVRSAYIREVFTDFEEDGPILPRDNDPFASAWAERSRFERLCWYWDHTNRMLADRVARRVKMEDLLQDYEVLRQQVLEPVGLQLDRTVWEQEVGRPKNTSSQFRWKQVAKRALGRRVPPPIDPLPHWTEWTVEQQTQFVRICGETMQRLGYETGF